MDQVDYPFVRDGDYQVAADGGPGALPCRWPTDERPGEREVEDARVATLASQTQPPKK